jgi:hypothetical protein
MQQVIMILRGVDMVLITAHQSTPVVVIGRLQRARLVDVLRYRYGGDLLQWRLQVRILSAYNLR